MELSRKTKPLPIKREGESFFGGNVVKEHRGTNRNLRKTVELETVELENIELENI